MGCTPTIATVLAIAAIASVAIIAAVAALACCFCQKLNWLQSEKKKSGIATNSGEGFHFGFKMSENHYLHTNVHPCVHLCLYSIENN